MGGLKPQNSQIFHFFKHFLSISIFLPFFCGFFIPPPLHYGVLCSLYRVCKGLSKFPHNRFLRLKISLKKIYIFLENCQNLPPKSYPLETLVKAI